MGPQKAFWWKVGYIVAIAVLVVPLHWLSEPATHRNPAGGKLAQLRSQYELSEANLGEIDVSAETVKLATLGLRGVAVDILWNKANDYKMTEDWASFGAVLTQIAYLQPHFYTVWDFQAHNLTYNTSVEFDDYHARYYWVMEGIKFLKLGQKENIHEPRLTGRIGWFIGQKIGKADEHRQYRRLFKNDEDFHAKDNPNRPRSKRDNWLVSYDYYKKGQEQVRERPDSLHTTPLIFHSQPLMSLINFAEALESDSTAGETPQFGEVAKNAWNHANHEKEEFGARDLAAPDNTIVHLNAEEYLKEREKDLEDQLEKLLPGEFNFDKLKNERSTPEERVALSVPFDKRTEPQENICILYWKEAAERTAGDRRRAARKLAEKLGNEAAAATEIRMSRDIVNYNYWKTRCEAEPTDDALAARELMYEAGQQQIEARPTVAKKLYEQSFAAWRKVLDRWKVLREDTLMAEDLAETVDKYREVLRQLAGADSKFPEHFVLQDMLDLNDRINPKPPTAATAKETAKPKETTKPKDTAKPKAETKPADKAAAAGKAAEKTPESGAPPAEKPTADKPSPDKPNSNKPNSNKPATEKK